MINGKDKGFGTIEGVLDIVLDDRGQSLYLFVVEPVSEWRVQCYLDDEALVPLFLAAFRKRVELKGSITYHLGSPVIINVAEISELPDSKGLPSFREMRGIIKKHYLNIFSEQA